MTETLEPSAQAVNDMAQRLMAAWKKAEPDHSITHNMTSYVATFADMARAALTSPAPQPVAADACPIAALKTHMEATGKTQADLAHLLGSRSRASEYLSGKRELPKSAIITISKAWGIPADTLIGRALASTAPTEEQVEAGWRLVPEEPTREMMVAALGWREYDCPDAYQGARQHYGAYRAMLAAAPAVGCSGTSLAEMVEAAKDILAHLVAAVSLLKRGSKIAVPSDKMFDQMILDYEASIERGRNALRSRTGEMK